MLKTNTLILFLPLFLPSVYAQKSSDTLKNETRLKIATQVIPDKSDRAVKALSEIRIENK